MKKIFKVVGVTALFVGLGWLLLGAGAPQSQFSGGGGGGSFSGGTVGGVILGPNGSPTAPTYSFSTFPTIGLYTNANLGPVLANNADIFGVNSSGTLLLGFATTCYSWSSSGTSPFPNGNTDTRICRPSAGVVEIGTTNANSNGVLEAASYISEGTKFTTNNGCTDSATAGGATAGTFTVGSTSCTEVVTMGNSATAPNGWSCTVVDITTLADVTNPHQTTSNATTATFVTGTVVSGDKIQFSCIGY
jgi:hypothetical protein